MIRMGRSSRTETSNDINDHQEVSAKMSPSFSYTNINQPSSTRAISESESMARDIKEGRLSGYVGNGTVLTGETNFQAMLRVDGHLTGRVASEDGTLVVGSTGRVDANIVVAAAIIGGMVNGDIVATEKLELGRSARVVGNIQTPRLLIEDGAIFEGSCSMLKAKEAFDKRSPDSGSQTVSSEYVPNYPDEINVKAFTDDYSEQAVNDDEETADAAAI